MYDRYVPSLDKIFHKRWINLYEDYIFYSLFPNTPFTVHKNRKAIKSLVSAKRRRFDTKWYCPSLQAEPKQEFKLLRFNCLPHRRK